MALCAAVARQSDSLVLLGRGALAHDVTRRMAADSAERRIVTVATTTQVLPGEHAIDPGGAGSSRMLAELLAETRASQLAVLCLSESPLTPSQPWLNDGAVTDMVVSALGRCPEMGMKPPSLVVLSSTAVYGVAGRSPLLFDEQAPWAPAAASGTACQRWVHGLRDSERRLLGLREELRLRVALLRAAAILGGPLDSPLESLLRSRFPVRVLGFDPPVQTLAYEDLVQAVVLAIEQRSAETLNIVGRSVVSLSRLLAMAGVFAPALPGMLADRVAPPAMDGERLRWRTIADGRRARQALGFRPERSLEDALRARR